MYIVINKYTIVWKNYDGEVLSIDSEGNEIVTYTPSYDLLDALGMEIGNNLFS